jgi:hypothetical protein
MQEHADKEDVRCARVGENVTDGRALDIKPHKHSLGQPMQRHDLADQAVIRMTTAYTMHACSLMARMAHRCQRE